LCLERIGSDRKNEADELAAMVSNHFSDALSEGLQQGQLREVPGSSAVFQALRARGARVIISSGFEEAVIRDVIVRLDWEVDGVVAARRPRPDAIFKAISMADIDNVGQVLKVGDTVADIEEGRNAGVWTAAVLTGTQGEVALRNAGPDFVLESVADILNMLPPLQDGENAVQAGPQISGEDSQAVPLRRPEAPLVGPRERQQPQEDDPAIDSEGAVFVRGELPHREEATAIEEGEEDDDGEEHEEPLLPQP